MDKSALREETMTAARIYRDARKEATAAEEALLEKTEAWAKQQPEYTTMKDTLEQAYVTRDAFLKVSALAAEHFSLDEQAQIARDLAAEDGVDPERVDQLISILRKEYDDEPSTADLEQAL